MDTAEGERDHLAEVATGEEEHMVFFSVFGMRRWDERARHAVAKALRDNTLTNGERIGLANLIDGSHPKGHNLKMAGQGNGLLMVERANAYARMLAVGKSVTKRMNEGSSWEEAIFDVTEIFKISESTASRDYQLYKFHLIDN